MIEVLLLAIGFVLGGLGGLLLSRGVIERQTVEKVRLRSDIEILRQSITKRDRRIADLLRENGEQASKIADLQRTALEFVLPMASYTVFMTSRDLVVKNAALQVEVERATHLFERDLSDKGLLRVSDLRVEMQDSISGDVRLTLTCAVLQQFRVPPGNLFQMNGRLVRIRADEESNSEMLYEYVSGPSPWVIPPGS